MIPLFSYYNQRKKNLECKLEQQSYGWCIFKLKRQKTEGKWYVDANKQQLSEFLRNCKVLRERYKLRSWSPSTKKKDTVDVFSV